jgi:hypothetical protein
MEADAVDEDEDKTRAGVPMSGPNPVAPALREPTRDRQRPMPKSTSSSDDARARDMLERVEAMAPQTLNTARPPAATASLPDQESMSGPAPMAPPSAENVLRPESFAPPISAEGSFPGPRPEDTNPGIDTPDDLMSPAAMVQAQPARRPPAFMGLVAASVGMAAMAVLLFGVGAVAFPPAVPATDYGVVMVTTTPPGATVIVDGAPQTTPTQVVLPLAGGEQSLEFTLPGFKSKTEKVGFGPGQTSTVLNVTLEPG